MTDAHELTVRIEETDTGEYRAQVDEAPEQHFAAGEDPMVAARGALAVARKAVYSGLEDQDESDPRILEWSMEAPRLVRCRSRCCGAFHRRERTKRLSIPTVSLRVTRRT